MGINVTGCLLRQERLRQNLSLEGVAGKICTAAYLSKIENGLAQPSPDMVRRLFAELKIDYVQDPEVLKEPAEALEQYFDATLHNEDTHQLAAYIRENQELLNNSPYHVDYHLFRLNQQVASLQYGNEVDYLAAYYDCMSESQRFYYHLSAANVQSTHADQIAQLRKAEHIRPCAVGCYDTAMAYYAWGKLAYAVEYGKKALTRAMDEGNPVIMLFANGLLAQCYGQLEAEEFMEDYYRRTLELNRWFRVDLSSWVYKNWGDHYLLKQDYPRALEQYVKVNGCPEMEGADSFYYDVAVYAHRAIACAKAGQPDEARQCVRTARQNLRLYRGFRPESQLAGEEEALLFPEMLSRPGYLDQPAYQTLLEKLYRTATNAKKLYGPFLVELYQYQRRYKDALRIAKKLGIPLTENS